MTTNFGEFCVPEEHAAQLDDVIRLFEAETKNEKAWKSHGTKNDVISYTKNEVSLTSTYGVGFIDAPPNTIAQLLLDPTKRSLYDKQLKLGKTLKVLDKQTKIDYLEYKPLFIASGRDFCNLTHWRVTDEGHILIVAKGLQDPKLCPLQNSKIVRGCVHLMVWKIIPNEKYSGATVHYMLKTDLKGNIPSWIVAKVSEDQPLLIHEIRQELSANLKYHTNEVGVLKNTITTNT